MLSSESSDGGSVPAFLNKLWKLVEETSTDSLIGWSQNTNGRSFIIKDQVRFTQELLPIYFKHNNMASFIRQLNMYGFRKVPSIESGSLLIDRGEIEFMHSKFIKGQKNLLADIKRKVQTPRAIVTPEKNVHDFGHVLSEIQTLKTNQEHVGSQLMNIKKENKILWRENASMRQKFQKQQQIIEKLVHFLMSMVKPTTQHLGPQRKFNQRALEGLETSDTSSSSLSLKTQDTPSLEFSGKSHIPTYDGPVIHEVFNSGLSSDPVILEKVFPTSIRDEISDIGSPTNAGLSHTSTNTKTNSKRINVKNSNTNQIPRFLNSLRANKIVMKQEPLQEQFSDSFDSPTAYREDEVTFTPLDEENALLPPATTFSSTVGISQPFLNSDPVTVHSPNGTLLMSSREIEEPPLSPELLVTVDPSDVNPNIVVTKMQKPLIDIMPTSYQDEKFNYPHMDASNIQSSLSNGVTKINNGKMSSMDNNYFLPKRKHSSVEKREPVIGSDTGMDNDEEEIDSFDDLLNFAAFSSSTGTEVAIPEKGDDLVNYVDHVDTFLNNFKKQVNHGKFGHVDPAILMSIFGNDPGSNFYSDSDSTFPRSGNISGNEIQLYGSSIYDDLDDAGISQHEVAASPFNFESLIEDTDDLTEPTSPPKKLKINVKKKKMDDDVLNTPRVDINFDTPQMFREKM